MRPPLPRASVMTATGTDALERAGRGSEFSGQHLGEGNRDSPVGGGPLTGGLKGRALGPEEAARAEALRGCGRHMASAEALGWRPGDEGGSQECTLPVLEDEPEAARPTGRPVRRLRSSHCWPGWRGTGVPDLEVGSPAFGNWLGMGRGPGRRGRDSGLSRVPGLAAGGPAEAGQTEGGWEGRGNVYSGAF